MSSGLKSRDETPVEPPRVNWYSRINAARRRLVPAVPIAVLVIVVFLAVAAPLITSYDPVVQDLGAAMRPPAWMDGGSSSHLLGTDSFGRDVFTRLVFGVRTSMLAVILALIVAVVTGAGLGIIAGYFGGWIDAALMRLVDIMLAMPSILVALALAVAVGPSFRNVVLILGLLVWPNIARLLRSEVLALKHHDFVRYAKAVWVPRWVVLIQHILPHVIPTLLVATTLEVANIILTEASLSFLGVGVPPPTPSWGSMIDEGRALIATGWWIALFPGIAIIVTVLAFNSLGDWLRDRFDPATSED